MAVKKNVPFYFILENLFSANPIVKPMFGAYAVYVENKIVLILRDKDDVDSGAWIATNKEYMDSLRSDFPSLKPITLFGDSVSGWQMIHKDADDFETSINCVCDLILKGDKRIGRIPKPRKSKKTVKMKIK